MTLWNYLINQQNTFKDLKLSKAGINILISVVLVNLHGTGTKRNLEAKIINSITESLRT